jgi:hypothetical protein
MKGTVQQDGFAETGIIFLAVFFSLKGETRRYSENSARPPSSGRPLKLQRHLVQLLAIMKHETNYQWRRENALRLRKGKVNGTSRNSVSSMLSSRNFQQLGGFIAPFTVEIKNNNILGLLFIVHYTIFPNEIS